MVVNIGAIRIRTGVVEKRNPLAVRKVEAAGEC